VDALTDQRQRLFTALQPMLPSGRVWAYPPAQLVAPCVFIETSAGSLTSAGNGTLLLASFPVVVVSDGDTKPSSLGLDELIANAYDLSRTVGSPTGWQARPLDAGGLTLRAATLTVEMPIAARTLCNPSIVNKGTP
jgi:hypothetical protein